MTHYPKGALWIGTGLLLIVASLSLCGWNQLESVRAGAAAKAIVRDLEDFVSSAASPSEASETELPDYTLDSNMDMPVETINGYDSIGLLEIPVLNLRLPVLSDWSYPQLQISPCRYKGSVYTNTLIIAAHNYASHFGQLKELLTGDRVLFTDIDGNRFYYTVSELEILLPSATDEMENGDWDLTLFTCTIGGQSRVTLRCVRTEAPPTAVLPT